MGPLQGVRILDFTQILSGPFCTMLLADAGADVVKVERPLTGDITRAWGPPFVSGESLYFAAFNRGKRSICLDLSDAQDLETAKSLAGRADVLVENLRPGALERRGLGAAALRAARPELIHVGLRGYDPLSDRRHDTALEVILEAESGMMAITGPEGGQEPVRLGIAAIDMLTGVSAVGRIFAALYQREKTGVGETIELSLEQSAQLMMTHPWLMYLAGGVGYEAAGSGHPNIAPYEVFSTADHPLMLAAVDDAQFRRLVGALGKPGWADVPRWSTNAGRVQDRAHLHDAIGAVLEDKSADHWVQVFRAAQLPSGVVQPAADAARIWQQSRAPRLSAVHPVLGALEWPTSPWAPEGGEVLAPPLLDADHGQILRDWLGKAE